MNVRSCMYECVHASCVYIMHTCDSDYSTVVSGEVKTRCYTIHFQVSENGFISMGEIPCTNSRVSSSCFAVAPYASNINTEIAGTVRYTDFNTYSRTGSSMITVSRFIRDETGHSFYGTKMMVAEWNGVAQSNGFSVGLLFRKI